MNDITVSSIFTSAGEVMTGFMDLTTDFVEGLCANPLGKIAISLTIVSGAIGLAYRLFIRRKRV